MKEMHHCHHQQWRDIHCFFCKTISCKVNDEQQLSDKRTGQHKGCAYVELSWVEDVHHVMEVSATTLEFQWFPILI